jgi:hypothetical protein
LHPLGPLAQARPVIRGGGKAYGGRGRPPGYGQRRRKARGEGEEEEEGLKGRGKTVKVRVGRGMKERARERGRRWGSEPDIEFTSRVVMSSKLQIKASFYL